MCWRNLDQREVLLGLEQGAEMFDLVAFRQQFDSSACNQRSQQTGDRGIEADRRIHGSTGSTSHVVGAAGPRQIVDDIAVLQQGSFWSSRGTGCVNDIGQII